MTLTSFNVAPPRFAGSGKFLPPRRRKMKRRATTAAVARREMTSSIPQSFRRKNTVGLAGSSVMFVVVTPVLPGM